MTMQGTRGAFAQIRSAAPPSLRPVADFLRALITSLDEACVEAAWPRQGIASFGVGPRKMSQHYAYIGVHGSHLNLGFYHGASLEDPAGILEGTGKRLRHVKVSGMAAAGNPAIRALLVQAIADRRRRQAGPPPLMQSKAKTLSEYLAGLTPKERSVVETLDKLVRSAAPKASGGMKYGMPTYELADRFIAFNAQRNYFSFYADPLIVKRHRAALKGLDVGKSCIRFRSLEEAPLATLRTIVIESAK